MAEHVEMNAVIESTRIEIERDILTAWLFLDYGGMGQGFGGYSLRLGKDFKHASDKLDFCGVFIRRCMEVGGVDQWDKLTGKTIRVRKTDRWGDIIAIGHIINDDWFAPGEVFDEMREAAE